MFNEANTEQKKEIHSKAILMNSIKLGVWQIKEWLRNDILRADKKTLASKKEIIKNKAKQSWISYHSRWYSSPSY